ncbi:MAG: hypothetical protein P8Y05_00235 [Deinococcales bacterium]
MVLARGFSLKPTLAESWSLKVPAVNTSAVTVAVLEVGTSLFTVLPPPKVSV